MPFVKRFFTGNWRSAAKKAMSAICRSKKVPCVSTLLINLREVTPSKDPLLDAEGIQNIRRYRMKRVKRVIDEDDGITNGGLDTSIFKYETVVLKSFGRIY
jgi:hypothetical protein